jgi:uncharacterized membrane protein YkoI
MIKSILTLCFCFSLMALKAQDEAPANNPEQILKTIDSETPIPFDQLPQEIVQQIKNSRFVTWEVVEVLWVEKSGENYYQVELKNEEEVKSIKFEKSWKIKREK